MTKYNGNLFLPFGNLFLQHIETNGDQFTKTKNKGGIYESYLFAG